MAKRSFLAADPPPELASTGGARTLIERAYEQLRNDIIEGQLAPGEKLRVEHLKTRYAVSAGTLREAITRLASDALVETEGQRGFRVAPIALEDLEDITRLRVQIETEASPWTQRVLRLLSRHGERYRSFALTVPGSLREVHAEHTEIYEYAMSGQDARAALALEAHIRATPDVLIRALREGRATLPGAVPI